MGLKMQHIPARILTYLFVLLAWIPFRAENISQTKQLFKAMFLPDSFALPGFINYRNLWLFIIGTVIIIFLQPAADLEKKFRPTWINAVLTIVLILASMFCFVKVSPFIYFNF